MIAFRTALAMKVDFIELDVRPSKDRVIMVIHDETVQRTTNGRGKVSGLTREAASEANRRRYFWVKAFISER